MSHSGKKPKRNDKGKADSFISITASEYRVVVCNRTEMNSKHNQVYPHTHAIRFEKIASRRCDDIRSAAMLNIHAIKTRPDFVTSSDSRISGFARPHGFKLFADSKVSTLKSGFQKLWIRMQFRRIRVDQKRIRKKKLRIQKYVYPDTCERDLTEWGARTCSSHCIILAAELTHKVCIALFKLNLPTKIGILPICREVLTKIVCAGCSLAKIRFLTGNRIFHFVWDSSQVDVQCSVVAIERLSLDQTHRSFN